MAKILGISAFGTGIAPKYWWEWTLVAVIGASGLVGLISFIVGLYKAIYKLYKVSSTRSQYLQTTELKLWPTDKKGHPILATVCARANLSSI
jgi:hypothetical protein